MRFELKESENFEKYCDEALYITAHYKSFLKNPQKFVGSYIKNMLYLSILFLVTDIYFITSAIIFSHIDGFEGAMLMFSTIFGLVCFFLYINGKNQIKRVGKTPRKSTMIIDENTIEIETKTLDDSIHVDKKINWNDIRFIKKNNLSIAIFTKTVDTPFIMISKNNQDKFLEALEHYNKTDLLVKY